MKTRIFDLIDLKELTPGKFADEIGVERSTMSHIKSDRSKPSLDMAQKVLERYPEVSAEWLILGRGPMLTQAIDSRELDLFSQAGLSNSQSEDNTQKLPTATEVSVDANYKPDNVSSENSPLLQNKDDSCSPKTPSKPERLVERVMIFYSDQTFEELKK